MVERRGGRGGVPAGRGGGVPHGAVAGPAGPTLGGRTRTDARSPSGNDKIIINGCNSVSWSLHDVVLLSD